MNKNKFKVWNGVEWVGAEEFMLDDLVEFSHVYKFPQFTGALDKKNQKIFEGDIVLWNNPDPYDGEEFVTKIVGYNCRTMGFRLYNFPEEIGEKCGSSFFSEDVEVVGNIFEGAVKDGVDFGQWQQKKTIFPEIIERTPEELQKTLDALRKQRSERTNNDLGRS